MLFRSSVLDCFKKQHKSGIVLYYLVSINFMRIFDSFTLDSKVKLTTPYGGVRKLLDTFLFDVVKNKPLILIMISDLAGDV